MKIDFKKMRPKNFNSYLYSSVEKLAMNVEKGSGNKNINNCPICKSFKRIKYIVKYKVPIVTCEKCDLTYTTKQPKNFNDVYSQDDYLKKSILSYDKTRKYRIKRFGLERIKILKKYKKKGKLLDFGCGTGWFLEGAKKHYDSYGVEYSDSIRKWLLKKLNINTFKTLESIKGNKFDIITAFDVIEHVSDPLLLLKNLKKNLKKNGIILIYTPNFDSLGFSYLGIKNNLLCPPNHLFYFNKSSFDYMCKKVNLKIIETQYRGLDIGDIYALVNEKGDKKTANFLNKNSTSLQKFLDSIGFSNHIRFVLKNK
jgi:2-polyprenyl-3-methyl-5-hydroxy-6-metoxy-1,4-benzoquinol methylase